MRYFAIPLIIASSVAIANVPPPPQLPETEATAPGLASAVESNNITKYEQFLSRNLEVWIDGKKVASTNKEWLNQFRPKLTTEGVKYRIERVLAGNQNFVLVTNFDSRGSYGVGRQECCQLFEVSQYEMKDGKVSTIRTLTTGPNDLTHRTSETFSQ